jgi:hypothetical protein
VLCVRWHLRFKLSSRDLVQIESAAPLLSHMGDAYGRLRILRGAQAFTSRYPQSKRRRDAAEH